MATRRSAAGSRKTTDAKLTKHQAQPPRKAASAGARKAQADRPAAKPASSRDAWLAWRDRAGAIDELCDYIVEGGNLWAFCQARKFPYSTVRDWIEACPERSAKYARAREDRSDKLADEIVAISDDVSGDVMEDPQTGKAVLNTAAVQRAKLRVDARKWVAAKLKPRVYGDKVQVDALIDTRSMSDEELAKRLSRFGITAILPQQGGTTSDEGDGSR